MGALRQAHGQKKRPTAVCLLFRYLSQQGSCRNGKAHGWVPSRCSGRPWPGEGTCQHTSQVGQQLVDLLGGVKQVAPAARDGPSEDLAERQVQVRTSPIQSLRQQHPHFRLARPPPASCRDSRHRKTLLSFARSAKRLPQNRSPPSVPISPTAAHPPFVPSNQSSSSPTPT